MPRKPVVTFTHLDKEVEHWQLVQTKILRMEIPYKHMDVQSNKIYCK